MAKSNTYWDKSHYIYGVHPVNEAMEASKSIEKIWVSRDESMGGKMGEIRRKAQDLQIPLQFVPDIKLEKLVGREAQHQGVVAMLSPIQYQDLETLILSSQEANSASMFVILDEITDVRNLGAIARTAECMGASGLVVPMKGGASLNADAMKSSAGALYHLPIIRVPNLIDAILMFQSYEIKVLAVTEKAQNSIYEQELRRPLALVMGSESKGISPSILKRIPSWVKIPMKGKIESLNVSVAAGIAMSEIIRQREE